MYVLKGNCHKNGPIIEFPLIAKDLLEKYWKNNLFMNKSNAIQKKKFMKEMGQWPNVIILKRIFFTLKNLVKTGTTNYRQ